MARPVCESRAASGTRVIGVFCDLLGFLGLHAACRSYTVHCQLEHLGESDPLLQVPDRTAPSDRNLVERPHGIPCSHGCFEFPSQLAHIDLQQLLHVKGGGQPTTPATDMVQLFPGRLCPLGHCCWLLDFHHRQAFAGTSL